MGILFNRNDGIFNVIRCDEPSYLIWKWHPDGTLLGNNSRENSIRWGSSLRVKDSEVAVFVYKQENGVMQDIIVGPYDDVIRTENFPVLTSIVGIAYGGKSPFQAEIYFINLAKVIQTKFAVPYFDVYDPRYIDFGVPVSVRGTISFKISNYNEFIKCHRLINFNLDDFYSQISDAVSRYAKEVVASAPSTNDIPVVQLESKLSQINDVVEYNLKERINEFFGVEVTGVDIGKIEIDKTSEGYNQLISITKDIDLEKARAEKEDYIERLRIQREEGQFAQHKSTETENIEVIKVEKQTEVGIAGADALGKMGSNNADSVHIGENGGSGTGFSPTSMMTEIAMGNVIGKNIANVMQTSLNGTITQTNNIEPPPVPETLFNVAVNGQPTGPYTIAQLCFMAQEGKINLETLVWKPGMTSWEAIKMVNDLVDVINSIPPIPNA